MNKIDFSSDKRLFLSVETGNVPVSCLCRTHLSCERPSPFVDVEHRQHGKGAVGILGQAAIAHLGKAPETFEGEEWMLDLGAHTGLASIRRFVGLGQWPVLVGPFVGEVFRLRRKGLEPLPLRLGDTR